MADLTAIQVVVSRARRRLRLQAAAEVGCAAVPLGACVGLTGAILQIPVLYGAAGALVLGGAVAAAAWPRHDAVVAARLDRASGLADRLTTAIALDGRASQDPVTRDLARLAVADGVRAADRADVRAAAPLRAPRHLPAALGSLALAAVIGAIGLSPATARLSSRDLGEPRLAGAILRAAPLAETAPALAPDDLAYLLALLDDVRAAAPDDPAVQTWADGVEALLAAAADGDLGRADLLAALDQLARPGDLGPLTDDVLEGVRQARSPDEPPTPPEPPPPPNGACDPGAEPDATPVPGEPAVEIAGAPTPKRGDQEDQELAGVRADTGTSRRDTVPSAAKHGFAGAAYRRVYADYRAVLEQVLHAEQVPSSYRYVVKRYFERIHPS